MACYYNEFDPFAAAWLRELMKAGHIPAGDIDERDMREVQPDDLRGYTQCHFFAGIGGWAYALRLAGWSDDRPVWTGSPPCQPFSVAGKGLGKADERHLAPHFLELVAAVRPPVLFGEQVAAAVTKDAWLDDLLDALERAGYTTGAAIAPACSVGAPHIRQRLWFVAERMCNSNYEGSQGRSGVSERPDQCAAGEGGVACGLAIANGAGSQQRSEPTEATRHRCPTDPASRSDRHEPTGEADSQWRDPDWIFCRDGKWRPTQSEIFPLADGIPNRVGILRGAGNAIAPQVGAEVIRAFMDGQQ